MNTAVTSVEHVWESMSCTHACGIGTQEIYNTRILRSPELPRETMGGAHWVSDNDTTSHNHHCGGMSFGTDDKDDYVS